EARHLSHVLGVTTEQASVFAVAAREAGVPMGEVTAAIRGLIRTLNTNEAAFATFGIATRDAAGQLRPLPDLLTNVIGKLMGMEAGTQRLTAAQQLFRRAMPGMVEDLARWVAQLEHARGIAERFGVEMSEEGVASARAFQAATADLGLAWLGIENILAETLRPELEHFIDDLGTLVEDGTVAEWAHGAAAGLSEVAAVLRPGAGLMVHHVA